MSASELFQQPTEPEREVKAPSASGAEFDRKLQEAIAELAPEAASRLRVGREGRSREDLTELVGLASRHQAEAGLTRIHTREAQGIARPAITDLCTEVLIELGKAYTALAEDDAETRDKFAKMGPEMGPLVACLLDVEGPGCEWTRFVDHLMDRNLPSAILQSTSDARIPFVLPGDRSYSRDNALGYQDLRDAYLNPIIGIGGDLFRAGDRPENLRQATERLHRMFRLAARFGQAAGETKTEGGYRFFKQEVSGFRDPVFNRLCDRFAQITHRARLQGDFYSEDSLGHIRPLVSWLLDHLPYGTSKLEVSEEDHLEFQSALGALLKAAIEKQDLVTPLILGLSEFLPRDPASPVFRQPTEGEEEEDSSEVRLGAAAIAKGLSHEVAKLAFARYGNRQKVRVFLIDALRTATDNRVKARAIETLILFRIPLTPDLRRDLEGIIVGNKPGRAAAIRFYAERGSAENAPFLVSALRSALRERPQALDKGRRIAFALGAIYSRVVDPKVRGTLAKYIRGVPKDVERAFGKGSQDSYLVITGDATSPSPPEEVPEPPETESPLAPPLVRGAGEMETPKVNLDVALLRVQKGDISHRVAAVAELEKHKTPPAIEALVDLLDDKNLAIRQNALHSLEQIGPPAVPFVEGRVESICGKRLAMRKDERLRPLLEVLYRIEKKGDASAKDAIKHLEISFPRTQHILDRIREELETQAAKDERRAKLNLTPKEIAEQHEAVENPQDLTALDKKMRDSRARRAGSEGPAYEMSVEEREQEKARQEKARSRYNLDDQPPL
jgi:hypothetical protein